MRHFPRLWRARELARAALGGLRVNRGIYCETHNNGFGDLANVLVQQFGM